MYNQTYDQRVDVQSRMQDETPRAPKAKIGRIRPIELVRSKVGGYGHGVVTEVTRLLRSKVGGYGYGFVTV